MMYLTLLLSLHLLLPFYGAQALRLGSCGSAINKVLEKSDLFVRDFQNHVCNAGCSFTAQDYVDQVKEQHHRSMTEKILRDLNRGESAPSDATDVLIITEEIVSIMAKKCSIETARAPNDSDLLEDEKKSSDFDFCADPKSLEQCYRQIRPSIGMTLLKHGSFVGSFLATTSCDEFVGAVDKARNRDIAIESMREYAKTCRRR